MESSSLLLTTRPVVESPMRTPDARRNKKVKGTLTMVSTTPDKGKEPEKGPRKSINTKLDLLFEKAKYNLASHSNNILKEEDTKKVNEAKMESIMAVKRCTSLRI